MFIFCDIVGVFNGFHKHRTASNSSGSGSELTVVIPDVRVKPEPISPKEDDHQSAFLDHNNNENCTDEEQQQKRRFFDASEADETPNNNELLPKTPRPRSPISKPINVSSGSIDLLQRIFPQQSRAVLELIVRSSDNDIVKAIESLIPDDNGYRFPAVSPVQQGLSLPYTGYPHSQDGRKSAFSPITKNGVCLNIYKRKAPPLVPLHSAPQGYPRISPSYSEHFTYPPIQTTPYGYSAHASAALLSLSNAKHVQGQTETKVHCCHCGFNINIGDKYCSECGKCLLKS